MSARSIINRAQRDARDGKSPSTQAGELVREEFHHIREGKHGARSAKQAIVIGLLKARRAGVKLPPRKRGKSSEKIRQQAQRDYEKGRMAETTMSLGGGHRPHLAPCVAKAINRLQSARFYNRPMPQHEGGHLQNVQPQPARQFAPKDMNDYRLRHDKPHGQE